MWLIARRTFAEGWMRMAATMLAIVFSVGLMAGSVQFAVKAQSAVSGSDASEYSRSDVLVYGGESPDEYEAYTPPTGQLDAERIARITATPGVAGVAGDALVTVTIAGASGKPVGPPAMGSTVLRPWVGDARLSPYRLTEGRAPVADGEVAVTRHVADSGRLSPGDTTTLLLPRRSAKVTVVGVVTVQGRGSVAAGDLVLAPPRVVQEAAGLPDGDWQVLWVKAAPGTSAAALGARLKPVAGAEATVRPAATVRREHSDGLAAAGVSVGGAVGMLAMVGVFTGVFVVANTFGTLVRQRTRSLALLAAVGATPRQIKRLVRLEALVLGALASAAGLPLGMAVSALLTRLFAEDGLDISAGEVGSGWWLMAGPFAAGVLVTQLAAWRAARRAARVAPMQALRTSTAEPAGRRWPRCLAALSIFGLSWTFLGPAFVVQHEPGPQSDRIIGGAILIMMGGMVCVGALAMLAPFFVGPLGGLVGRLGTLVSGEAGRLARATITRSPRRVSSAASALMLGVALVSTAGLMIISVQDRFVAAGRETVLATHALMAEGETAGLPADVAERVARVPGVEVAAALTQTSSRLVSPAPGPDWGPVAVGVTGIDPAARARLLRLGDRVPALRPGEISLTPVLLKDHGLRPGGRITLRGARGDVTLTVAGRHRDSSHLFADEALVEPSTLRRLDPGAAALAVLVRAPSLDRADLAPAVADLPAVAVHDRDGFVRASADRMEQGLLVIYGFLVMALVIALFGMATTISLSVGERTREFGLLGAVGATAGQIRAIVRWEAATVVVLGTLLGLGAAYGTVGMIHLVTGTSFIRPVLPVPPALLVVGAAAVITLAVSALPARRAAEVPVLEAAKAG